MENYCANCTYVSQSDSMSPVDNNSNPNNLRRVVKRKRPGIPFICQLLQQYVFKKYTFQDTIRYKCWRKWESGCIWQSRLLWYVSFKWIKRRNAIAIFFFVSLWRRESSHRIRFRIDIYDIKRDKKKKDEKYETCLIMSTLLFPTSNIRQIFLAYL